MLMQLFVIIFLYMIGPVHLIEFTVYRLAYPLTITHAYKLTNATLSSDFVVPDGAIKAKGGVIVFVPLQVYQAGPNSHSKVADLWCNLSGGVQAFPGHGSLHSS